MRILLLGCNGQVGWELQRSLAPLGELVALDRRAADFTQPEALAATVRQVAPTVIVNAAAHTAVDQAEREPELADALNAQAVGVLAREAQALGAWMVHYSTDYVFDGSGTAPWTEDSPTGPLSVYGRTKLAGERLLQQHCSRHLVFRTSWVYAARGGNFAKTMLRLAAERERLTVVDDQFGAPTGAELLADVTALALRQACARGGDGLAGIYHLAAAGETSWHGYARFVIDFAQQRGVALKAVGEAVQPVPSSAFKAAAPRPANSRLDTRKLRAAFGLELPAWQCGVARMLTETLERTA
ncbi:dTDP-4-dehydrorhamnose reductase [Pseudorhodoferax sp.]|uniref:dTDP-4-dehydrorhamnose reductase n=1 Tax=Pseudorhodoferax sp. TaxID=1993553 RepID=UPI0039E71B0A